MSLTVVLIALLAMSFKQGQPHTNLITASLQKPPLTMVADGITS